MKHSGIIQFTFFILLLASAVSCESDADMGNAPQFRQKLIISSFISPSDTVSYFDVTTNLKIFGELNTEEPLGLVSGTISNGLSVTTLEGSSKGLKISDTKMQIKYGSTYQIKIRSSNGLTAEATSTVPSKKNFSISVDTFSVITKYPEYDPVNPGQYHRKINFRVGVTDIGSEENYYRIFAIISGRFTYTYNNQTRRYRRNTSLPFEKEFFTDKGVDGKNIILLTDNKYDNYNEFFSPQCDSMVLKIYLYNTEKSYYLFHKSLADYNDGENPFAESSPVFSNITGGSGIFTSYTVDSLVIKFK